MLHVIAHAFLLAPIAPSLLILVLAPAAKTVSPAPWIWLAPWVSLASPAPVASFALPRFFALYFSSIQSFGPPILAFRALLTGGRYVRS
jgi:hypothetical protein